MLRFKVRVRKFVCVCVCVLWLGLEWRFSVWDKVRLRIGVELGTVLE